MGYVCIVCIVSLLIYTDLQSQVLNLSSDKMVLEDVVRHLKSTELSQNLGPGDITKKLSVMTDEEIQQLTLTEQDFIEQIKLLEAEQERLQESLKLSQDTQDTELAIQTKSYREKSLTLKNKLFIQKDNLLILKNYIKENQPQKEVNEGEGEGEGGAEVKTETKTEFDFSALGLVELEEDDLAASGDSFTSADEDEYVLDGPDGPSEGSSADAAHSNKFGKIIKLSPKSKRSVKYMKSRVPLTLDAQRMKEEYEDQVEQQMKALKDLTIKNELLEIEKEAAKTEKEDLAQYVDGLELLLAAEGEEGVCSHVKAP